MNDYPAAHSMDTTWFCVDECGHVAMCTSGENGAVPSAAAREVLDVDYRDALSLQEIAPEHVTWLIETHRDLHHVGTSGRGTVALKPLPEPLRKELEKWTSQRVSLVDRPDGSTFAVIKVSAPGFFHRVHEAKLCICCAEGPFEYRNWQVGTRWLFGYEHDSWMPAPYILTFAPRSPMRVEEIENPGVRAQVSEVSMPGCFLDRKFWQPAETHPCSFWSNPDTAIRPFGGAFLSVLREFWR